MHSVGTCPTGKMCFWTEEGAAYWIRTSETRWRKKLRAYKCDRCEYWHTSTKRFKPK